MCTILKCHIPSMAFMYHFDSNKKLEAPTCFPDIYIIYGLNTFKRFVIPIYWFWAYMLKVISETLRTCSIKELSITIIQFCLQSKGECNHTVIKSIHVETSIQCEYWKTTWYFVLYFRTSWKISSIQTFYFSSLYTNIPHIRVANMSGIS